MTDFRTVAPEALPRPVRLGIDCPCCGQVVEYEPAEDDAGAFHAEQDWPVCEQCGILIDVPPVRIMQVNHTYHVRGAGR